MAKTAFATSDNETKKLWVHKLFKEAIKETYFSRYMSEKGDNIVLVKTDLTQDKGDRVRFTIVMRLTGAGVTEGMALEGNEEKLTTYTTDVTLGEYSNAVRDRGPLDRQRVAFSIDEVSQERLKGWASEKIDTICFDAILDMSGGTTKIFYKTSSGITTTTTEATAKGALTAADSKLTPAMISYVKTWAKTGGNRSYVPIEPIKINGRNYWVMLTHPDALTDLKLDSTMQQALREAQERGKDNPLFTDAALVWDNVIIHEHENVTIGTDAGSGGNVPYTKAVLMGKQALLWAEGKRYDIKAEEFDYGREHGYGWTILANAAKPVFNSKDYGSVGLYLARTNISGL